MVSPAVKFFTLISLVAMMDSTADAQSRAPSDADFIGAYTQGGMESRAQLFLLEDNTFCFTFMGGNLDLVKAGRWKAGKTEGTIDLMEIRPDISVHPATGRIIDRLGAPKVGINFDGYTLSDAISPVFAVTRTATPPTKFRPLFSKGNSTWSGTYALPLLTPEEAKYFFIGDIETDKYEKPKRLRVTQYEIGHYDAIRIGFNRIQSEPPLNMNARLEQGILWLGEDKFGAKEPLAPNTMREVREQCINPVLHRAENAPSQEEGKKRPPQEAEMLTPIKSFYLDLTAISGKPFFDLTKQVETRATDSQETLVESEKEQLETAFKHAMADIRSADEFLNLAKSVAEKKQRRYLHAPLLVKLYAELLVATNAKGNFDASEKIFFRFKEDIYPATVVVKNDSMSYGLSVIASQGLIITTKTKNAKVSDFVFGTLLGKEFDITTHKNRTLIYNLACYYATVNNKTPMLDAIKEVRRRGTPAKQFLDDSDFKNYLTDVDFLSAVNN